MISVQTNVDSLNAQTNLGINNNFQGRTIQQLTSGYRINSSGDDAAGLAIANGYRNNIAELNQGISNANTGVSQLQIIDGGLSNISTILDRMKTLATQSASGTLTGSKSRATLDQEYQGLIQEITRQASNINLNLNGSFNTNLNVYIGGANNATQAGVNINLGGASNAVDASSLGLATSNVLAGGTGFAGNAVLMNAAGAMFLTAGGTATQTLTFNLVQNGVAQQVNAVVTNGGVTTGITADQVLSQLNTQLNSYGIQASEDSSGKLQFSGGTPFTIQATGAVTGGGASPFVTPAQTATNNSLYTKAGAASFVSLDATNHDTEQLDIITASGTATVQLNDTNTASRQLALNAINQQTAQYGVYAIQNAAGTGITFQSASNFSVKDTLTGGAAGSNTAEGVFGHTATGTTALVNFETAPGSPSTNASATGNAVAALTAINTAIQTLGLVQGKVGAGENMLQYAINLANSQVSNFSAAQSVIRDANIAQQAANLTKSQVLTQTSIAAMAQANAEPQSVLKLLQ